MWENQGQLWGWWLENRAEGTSGFELRHEGPLIRLPTHRVSHMSQLSLITGQLNLQCTENS